MQKFIDFFQFVGVLAVIVACVVGLATGDMPLFVDIGMFGIITAGIAGILIKANPDDPFQ